MSLCFLLQTAPLVDVPVVVGVVSTGLIIVTVVVVIVCLLIVVKHKHRKNRLSSFHLASQFFYRYVEKKDLKVKLRHTILEHIVLSEFSV